MKKFSVKIFLLICVCVILPFLFLCFYISSSMEKFIREQPSDRVLQNISRNERNFYDSLQKMAYFSNSLIWDEELQQRMSSGETSHYENAVYFQSLLERMMLNGQDEVLEAAQIILFDKFGRCYSNWDLNFQDYYFLLEEDWVKEANEDVGHIVWSMFNPAYIMEDAEDEQYISLARAVLDQKTAGNQIATLIMSIRREAFSNLMMEYADEGDKAFVCIGEGQILMDNDVEKEIGEEEVRSLCLETEGKREGMLRRSLDEKEYLICYYTLRKPWEFDGQPMKIIYFTDYEGISDQIAEIVEKVSIVSLMTLTGIILITVVAVRLVIRPISTLTREMNGYSIDRQITGIDISRKDEIGELNRAFCRMSDNLKGAFRKAEEEYKIREQYRYESLRAQLNPHFLFNTLTSIRWMAVIRGADNIVESIDALASLLKYSMGKERGLVALREELENIRNYVAIQNIRYGEHVILDIDVEKEIENLRTMKFILQPIVENSIIHGYDSRQKKELTIYVYGDTEENVLNLYVEDDGIGISESQIEEFENGKHTAERGGKLTGIGLHHVDECLRITFGEEYGLKLTGKPGQGIVVHFVLPLIQDGESREETDEKSDDR